MKLTEWLQNLEKSPFYIPVEAPFSYIDLYQKKKETHLKIPPVWVMDW